MAKHIYERWPGYKLEDLDCRYCLYYGGGNKMIKCLAAECVCKEELKEILLKERNKRKIAPTEDIEL